MSPFRRDYPIVDLQAAFQTATAFLRSFDREQLQTLLDYLPVPYTLIPPRQNDNEGSPVVACLVFSGCDCGDVDLHATVVDAHADELTGIASMLGVVWSLVVAAVPGRRLRDLRNAVAKLRDADDVALDRVPRGRLIVDKNIAGRGLATLLECQWGDVRTAPQAA